MSSSTRGRSRLIACRSAFAACLLLEPFSLLCTARPDQITSDLGKNAGDCCYAEVRTALALAARPVAQAGGFGSVAFPTSGSAEAQPSFLRGVAALHSFEYEEANNAFRQAQTIDPSFAMAYWG